MPDLGSSNTPTPTPRGYTGGPNQFAIVRAIDGHQSYSIGEEGRNCYYPNGDPDMASETGETGIDLSPEQY